MFSLKNKLDKNLKTCLDKSYYNSYRVLIKCKKFFDDIEKKIPTLKGNIIRSIDSIDIICANLNSKAIYRLIEYPEVKYICFDDYAILSGLSINTANCVNLSNDFKYSGNGINIGLIDSGIYPHKDLLTPINKIKKFVDLINNLNFPYDDNGHGTALAGVMCSSGISSKSIYKGIATKSMLICYKAFNSVGKAFISDILFSIQSLIRDKDFPVNILCLPFELLNNDFFIIECFDNIFKIAIKNKIIPIIPTGNNLNIENSIRGLALSENCIVVGGLNTCKSPFEPYIYSSCGNKNNLHKPHLVAACVNIMCLNSNISYISEKNGLKLYPPKLEKDYISFNGTSIACAYVCGSCALLLEHNPKLQFKDICSLIKISCNPIENYNKSMVGEGTLDLSKFIQ
ncbi:S8 family serine peptidase [Clostridium tarantellae]|uniref:S8 family serine peptidase n=1 Tax=Clostridium tarantellae TaxID=39493 RepID=A0A6I1MR94_9CLOT|nr:S8 family serine peptidase [Clostridium tarantellae]MPQ43401.1 S8 family serine peptidase [Clostridium tarantellae]